LDHTLSRVTDIEPLHDTPAHVVDSVIGRIRPTTPAFDGIANREGAVLPFRIDLRLVDASSRLVGVTVGVLGRASLAANVEPLALTRGSDFFFLSFREE
jgi:hypothetical protein